jgi:hypothetical protein
LEEEEEEEEEEVRESARATAAGFRGLLRGDAVTVLPLLPLLLLLLLLLLLELEELEEEEGGGAPGVLNVDGAAADGAALEESPLAECSFPPASRTAHHKKSSSTPPPAVHTMATGAEMMQTQESIQTEQNLNRPLEDFPPSVI